MLQQLLDQQGWDPDQEISLEEMKDAVALGPDKAIRVEREMAVCQGSDPSMAKSFNYKGDADSKATTRGIDLDATSVEDLCNQFYEETGCEFIIDELDDDCAIGAAPSEEMVRACLNKDDPMSFWSTIAYLPSSFIEKGYLKKIYAVDGLESKTYGKCGGLGGQEELYFDVSASVEAWSAGWFQDAILHEIYHMIDANDDYVNDPEEKAWRSFLPDGFLYNNESGGYGDLSNYKRFKTLEGGEVQVFNHDGHVAIKGGQGYQFVQVEKADNEASNGVAHIISGVLFPPYQDARLLV